MATTLVGLAKEPSTPRLRQRKPAEKIKKGDYYRQPNGTLHPCDLLIGKDVGDRQIFTTDPSFTVLVEYAGPYGVYLQEPPYAQQWEKWKYLIRFLEQLGEGTLEFKGAYSNRTYKIVGISDTYLQVRDCTQIAGGIDRIYPVHIRSIPLAYTKVDGTPFTPIHD